jgi:hypothetical protein
MRITPVKVSLRAEAHRTEERLAALGEFEARTDAVEEFDAEPRLEQAHRAGQRRWRNAQLS